MNPMFVALTYCNILILVVIHTYRTKQNIYGKSLMRQYKHFVVKGLFQQNQNWWRLVVTMDKIFVARDYCDNTNILWRGPFQNRCDKADKHGCFDLMPH
jgi:hypothetical protein